jgi:transposase
METISEIDESKIIYIDESGIDDNEVNSYAWSKKGRRANSMKYGERKIRLSMIGSLNVNIFFAPFVFEGSCNRSIFEIYIEKVLLPNLKPGQIIILDNASIHKKGKIAELIASAECSIIYLPPYSPDLNPIEHHWFSVKHRIKNYLQTVKRDIYEAAIYTFS